MDTDRFISITKAAREHDSNRATIYRALDDGRLNGAEIAGRRVVVRDEKWDEFEPMNRGSRHPNYGANSEE